MTKLGIVVIGRNEGERLVCCLRSIGTGREIVYVDSGSSDGSIAVARASNARVVELDMSQPFTAARARNAGRVLLSSDCDVIQFVDGDCMVQPSWLEAGMEALRGDPKLAAVFGRRREVAPEVSRYNWMCDVEWAVPPGPARYFGGDVMLRASALDAAGGYPDEMIAGEEPDLAIRLREGGWSIVCLPIEMTAHDAAIVRFGQWWRRTVRSGHAYAELAARHRGRDANDYGRRLGGTLFWGAALPLTAFTAVALGLATAQLWIAIGGLFLLTLPLLQLLRLVAREKRRRTFSDAAYVAGFLMLAKPAQSVGIARYWLSRIAGKRTALIEYKR